MRKGINFIYKNTLKKNADLRFDITNNIIMLFLLLIVTYPLFFVLIASISDPLLVNAGKVILWPRGITFKGYARIFEESKIWIGYKNSIYYTLLGTVISVVLTITSGFSIANKHLRYKGLVMVIFMVPMFFRGGLIPRYLVVSNLGMIDTIWAMVLPNALFIWNVIIVRTFFKTSIPEELYEAASIDGCGILYFFSRIAIPLSKPVIAVMVLYYAVFIWNGYFDALIFLESEKMQPLQLVLRNILIVNQISGGNEMMEDVEEMVERQKLAELLKYGIIIVSSLPMLILYPFIQKYFVKGIMLGSIKG